MRLWFLEMPFGHQIRVCSRRLLESAATGLQRRDVSPHVCSLGRLMVHGQLPGPPLDIGYLLTSRVIFQVDIAVAGEVDVGHGRGRGGVNGLDSEDEGEV